MSEIPFFDRLRAWTEGTLAPAERAELEQDMARDPDLRRQAEEFRCVWSATTATVLPAAASATTFADLVRREPAVAGGEPAGAHFGAHVGESVPRARPAARWRRVAAACLVLIPAAWWAVVHFAPRAEQAVLLRAIQLDADANSPARSPAARIPPILAHYAPIENGRIRWIESLEEARAISRAVGRPVFVFGYFPTCPLCALWNKTTFVDPKVQADVEKFVPVAIDLSRLSQEEMQRFYEKRYPYLEFESADGAETYLFPGNMDEVDLPAELESGARSLAADARALTWSDARALAQALAAAGEALSAGRMGEADRQYALVLQRTVPGSFTELAREGERQVGAAAREAIDSARLAAHDDESAARSKLEREIARFEGTPYASDLRSVLDSWRASGRFPQLRQGAP